MKRDAKRTIKIKTLITCFFVVLVVEVALKMTMARTSYEHLFLLGLARLLQTGAFVGVIVILEGGLAAIGLERHTLYRGMKKGFFWSAGFGIAALVVFGLLSMTGFDDYSLLHTRLPDRLYKILLFVLIGGVLSPVTEEIFFRGILYGFFRRWGVFIALVLSTGIFLLAHPLRSGIPVPQLVGGILFAVAYEVEGCLMVPITIHCLGNLSIFSISLVF